MLPRTVALPLAWERPPALGALGVWRTAFLRQRSPALPAATAASPLFSEAVCRRVLALTTDFLVK